MPAHCRAFQVLPRPTAGSRSPSSVVNNTPAPARRATPAILSMSSAGVPMVVWKRQTLHRTNPHSPQSAPKRIRVSQAAEPDAFLAHKTVWRFLCLRKRVNQRRRTRLSTKDRRLRVCTPQHLFDPVVSDSGLRLRQQDRSGSRSTRKRLTQEPEGQHPSTAKGPTCINHGANRNPAPR